MGLVPEELADRAIVEEMLWASLILLTPIKYYKDPLSCKYPQIRNPQ